MGKVSEWRGLEWKGTNFYFLRGAKRKKMVCKFFKWVRGQGRIYKSFLFERGTKVSLYVLYGATEDWDRVCMVWIIKRKEKCEGV